MALLKAQATTLVRATKADISSWKQRYFSIYVCVCVHLVSMVHIVLSQSEYVLSHIALLPKGGGAYKTASMLVFMGYLIKMYCMHPKEVEKHGKCFCSG